MKIADFDLSEKILLIAEIGNNHEGSYALAEDLIGLAAEAGAGAVKFQTFKAQYFVSQKDVERFNRLKSFELSEQEFIRLSEHARKAGVLFISTPLDIESAKFLAGIVASFKIASGDNNFYPLLEYVAETEKPVIMSSGLADIGLIKKSQDFVYKIWKEKNVNPGLAILHCITAYPVPLEQVNLLALRSLQDELNCTIGYSDHTLGINACQLAVALGARIIEKHFTINKNYSPFRDHQLSAEPDELKQLAQNIKEAELVLGSAEKIPQPAELDLMQAVRRSIVAKKDLSRGHLIDYNDLMWIRPGDGLAPGNEGLLVGKKLKTDIPFGCKIMTDLLE